MSPVVGVMDFMKSRGSWLEISTVEISVTDFRVAVPSQYAPPARGPPAALDALLAVNLPPPLSRLKLGHPPLSAFFTRQRDHPPSLVISEILAVTLQNDAYNATVLWVFIVV